MKALKRLWKRLRNLASARHGAARLREEMEAHIAFETEESLRAGMTPAEARRHARIKFGPSAAIAESYHAEHGLPWLENLWQDLRFALRQLRKSPSYALVAVLTLALGIGANSAIFLLTWSILLKSLPVPRPAELIRYTFRKGESEIGLSYSLYTAIAKRQTAAKQVFALETTEGTVRRDGQAVKLPMAFASGSIFDVMEMRIELGRGFDRRSGEPGAPYVPEVVLANDYWRTRFHADPGVLGQSLNIENQTVTIVGVLGPGFDGVGPDQRFDLLLPLEFERVLHQKGAMLDQPGAFWLTVMGRMRPGVTLKQAQANMIAIRNQVNQDADPKHIFFNGGFFSSYTLAVEAGRSGRSWLRYKFEKPLLALEALCALMMLLCSINVALLVVSRVSGRLQEFAMRNALGAGRGRLLAQVLTEVMLLGICGLFGGALLGWQLARTLVAMISTPGYPEALHLHAGVVVFAFTASITLASALLAGVWPAWRASHTAPATDLKQTVGSHSANRMGRFLIPAQVALGVVLLNAALLTMSTLRSYLKENSGFAAGNTVMGQVELGDSDLAAHDLPGKIMDFLRQIETSPGVQSAALMSMPPLGNGFSVGDYYSRDQHGSLHVNHQVWPESVSRNYFSVMGTRIVQGRGFAASDATGDRVCILSAGAAAFFFPGRPAIGEFVNAGDGAEKASDKETCRVIGIAEDAKIASLLEPAPLAIYQPIEREANQAFAYSSLGVRAANSETATSAIRRAASRVFPAAPLPRTWLFRDAVDYNLSRQRLLSSVSGGFALLALVLVASGLYGILSRTVTERRREIGIRMAMGARRNQVVAGLARTAALRVAIGLAAGAGLAAMLGRLMRSLLYGITPGDPGMALTTLAVLAAVLGLAFVFPATRAASVDPMQALREE
jgi:predicted permease